MLSKHNNITFKKGRNLALCHAILTLIIVVTDCINYHKAGQNALLISGLPLLLILFVSIIHIIVNEKTWKNWFTINTLIITFNISASVVIRAIYKDDTLYTLMNTIHAITIIFASGVVLRSLWTYIYAFVFIVCLIIASQILDSKQLDEKMLALIIVVLGVAFATDRYIKAYQKSKKEIIKLRQQTKHLEDSLHKEQDEIEIIIAKIKRRSEKANLNISKELNELNILCGNGAFKTLTDFIANSSSEEAVFIKKLTKNFPDLSPRDLTLCVLLNQGLSSKEIAEELSCSPNSIKVYRSQLRKKICLKQEESLTLFLNKLYLQG